MWRHRNAQWSIDLHRQNLLCVHQICVVRRSVIEDAIALVSDTDDELRNVLPDALIYAAVAKLVGWYFSNEIGYVWHMTPGGFHTTVTTERYRALRDFINQSLLKV